MKKDIHPKVNMEATVTCVCGNSFTTISTLPSITVDICSNCHPFFTGQHKFVDTEGRIDKFKKKAQAMADKKKTHEEIKLNKKKKTIKANTSNKKPSLKEMMSATETSTEDTK